MNKPVCKPVKQAACASNGRLPHGKWIPACLIWLLTPLLWAEVSHGLPFDLQGFIDRKLSEGENYIQLPQGRHRVAVVTNLSHLNLNGLQDITIDGTGSELICTQTTRAITIKNCHNLKLVGLTIDYDPLPFTQGRIVGISGDKLTVEVEIMAGYPDADTLTGNKIEIFGGETGELVTTTYYNVSFETKPGTRRFSLRKLANYRDVSKENVGDIVVATSAYAPGGSKPHAIYMDASTNVTMEDVTLYASNMFGFFETNCSGSCYFRCVVDRRPLEEDLHPRKHRRMRSLEADGFHSKFALVGPSYFECISRYNGDDGIAINGDYHVITGSKGNRLRVVGKMGTDPKLEPGTRVELVSHKGERIEDALVCAIAPARSVSLTETRFLEEQGFYGDVARTSSAKRAWTVTLDREVDFPMGSLIADTSRVGNYFMVKNCTIGPN